jgi:hypothetical protein
LNTVCQVGDPLSPPCPICQIQYATSARSRNQPSRSHMLRDTEEPSHLMHRAARRSLGQRSGMTPEALAVELVLIVAESVEQMG